MRLLTCPDRGVIGCVPRAGLGSGVFGGELVDGHPGGEPVEFGGHGRAVTGGVVALLEARCG
jgi:hypothetical protein